MRPSREHATRNEQTYFVTSATWGRRQLFRNERWAKLLVDTFYHYRGKACLLHEFVVMPDHFHILITPTTSLERAVQFIKGGFSHRAKLELQSSMEIWQKGFSDHRIRDAQDYATHVEYIRANAVRKGLCQEATEYLYSSAHSRFELDAVPQRLKPLSFPAAGGAAEAAPFQRSPQGLEPVSSVAGDGTPEGVPFQSKDIEHDDTVSSNKGPQGLKPSASVTEDGAPKGAPFQSKSRNCA